MRVLAPAKINLHLRVGKRRDDGFHPLLSWMCTVGLFDILILERARPPQSATFSCNRADLPTDQSNLVLRAKSALAAVSQTSEQTASANPLTIRLDKLIPHGAGLGGGSSDATRTLLAINSLLKLGLGKDQLKAVAAQLGSDLSFFFHEPSAICTGRGEIVEPTDPPLPGWGVLILPDIHMPTPAVYRRFDEMNLGYDLADDTRNWSKLSSTQLLQHLKNDLELPAFSLEPTLEKIKDAVERLISRTIRMSGSGSTLFTLYDHQHDAEASAERITRQLNLRAIAVQLAPIIRDDLHGDLATH